MSGEIIQSKKFVFDQVIAAVGERLPRNERIRRNLPDGGRLRIDRQLPFLCVYRIPVDRDDAGTCELVTTEAAYLVVPGDEEYRVGVSALCQEVCRIMLEHFGIFLLIEIWSTSEPSQTDVYPLLPRFRISVSNAKVHAASMCSFQDALQEMVSIARQAAEVTIEENAGAAPPGLSPLLEEEGNEPGGSVRIGIEVDPVYRSRVSGAVFPIVLDQFRRQLAHALRRGVSQFVKGNHHEASHFEAYGPTSMVKAVREVDQQLSEVADKFDFLLQVTPVNSDSAWEEFSAGGYEQIPTFYYRSLPYHPHLLKRQLFETPVERVEDPTLAHLFWEKQVELDRQLSALRDLETPAFLQASLQLHGGVDGDLLDLAQHILQLAPLAATGSETEHCLKPEEIAQAAREEIDFYHQQAPAFVASVEIRNDISSGLMVSRGRLLISQELQVVQHRIQPLLQHEVGTHLVTYFNGRNQPFRQLSTGLAGYEALQEGLAVLSEYLVGGLSVNRVRTLAARVLAVKSVIDGASFIETFRLLHKTHNFSPRSAYTTTLRVHRGGGFTKDTVYLRGLQQVLAYLRDGHEIEPLYVGKFALEQVLFIQELRRREMIHAPVLLPRFWETPELRQRLEDCRQKSVLELLELPS